MKNKILYVIVAIMIMGSASSCKKWLEVYSDDRIMENNLFKTQEGYLIALNGIYIDLISSSLYNGYFTASGFDVLAQYWATDGANQGFNKLANFDTETIKTVTSNIWNKCYPMLTNINTIIEHCESGKDKLSSSNYLLIKGEALALRALIHFELFRVFGPICSSDDMSVKVIPYSDRSLVEIRPLLSATDIVAKINADLLEAEKLLKDCDPVITKGPDHIEKGDETNDLKFRSLRLNYFAVKALTARVALYTNDKEKAFAYASSVVKETMEDNQFFPFTPRAFAQQSTYEDKVYASEILFGIYNTKAHTDIHEVIYGRNKEDNQILMMPDKAIATLYDGYDGDIRRLYQWKDEMNPNVESRTYFIKYQKPTATTGSIATMPNLIKHLYYIPVIKVSEMLLIMAECKYETDPQFAVDVINKIRFARNAPDITINSNLLTSVQYEIAREFIGEGQLFWFYKRNNFTQIPQLSYDGKMFSMENSRYYFTIPQNEIDTRK